MQKFELPSLEEVDQLEQRLKGKTIDEIISLLGLPAKELGPGRREGHCDQCGPYVVEFSRRVEILGVGVTVQRLVLAQIRDGGTEFTFCGKEIQSEDSTA
jgi:hypothetical protein